MWRNWLAALALLAVVGFAADSALAQKQGGTLQVYHRDSPASMSIHEEATWSTIMPMMGVFNNLVLYDQHIKQNTLATIRPELATSWNWNEDGTELTFKLRRDVKWHDGKPFTAADVKCTWDLLLGRGKEKLRLNPRETWYLNLAEITRLLIDEGADVNATANMYGGSTVLGLLVTSDHPDKAGVTADVSKVLVDAGAKRD